MQYNGILTGQDCMVALVEGSSTSATKVCRQSIPFHYSPPELGSKNKGNAK